MSTPDDEKVDFTLIKEVGDRVGRALSALKPGDVLKVRQHDGPGDIRFSTRGGTVLIITPDGRLERGEGFATDDAASVAFFEVMSTCFGSWISVLRQRADKAEAELRWLNFEVPTRAAFGKLGGMLTRFAANNHMFFDGQVSGWHLKVGPTDTPGPPFTRIDGVPGAKRGMLAEDLGLDPYSFIDVVGP